MQVQVREIAGKVLVAYAKGSTTIVGEARRVNVETGERRKERWLVQEGDALTGIMPSWDAAAKYFRDEGHTVKAVDSKVLDSVRDDKPRAAEPRSFAARRPKAGASASA